MRKIHLWKFVTLLALAWGEVLAAPITYDLSFGSGTPDRLTGSITTDGTSGPIGLGNILGWSFTSVGTVGFSISSSAPSSADTLCTLASGCFTGDSSTLSFDFASLQPGIPMTLFHDLVSNVVFAAIGGPDSPFEGVLQAVRARPDGSSDVHNYVVSSVELVVATAPTTSSVPEPGVIALLGAALVAWFGVTPKRVRRRPSAAI